MSETDEDATAYDAAIGDEHDELLTSRATKRDGLATPSPSVPSIDARSGEAFATWPAHSEVEARAAVTAASAVHVAGCLLDTAVRSALLGRTAEALEGNRNELLDEAARESGLSTKRLSGELDRACAQLRLMRSAVETGLVSDVFIDHEDSRGMPDVRSIRLPLGPVVVFPSSNFPFAFGVAGNDTAAAFAAGCPVVVKGHPAHPSTSDLLAKILQRAVDVTGLPSGTFAHVMSGEPAVSLALVEAVGTAAVGFTGSLGVGRALFDAAAQRPAPIPVFAEMGSINPVVVTPAGWDRHSPDFASGLAASVASHAGQLCTKPGLVLAPTGPIADQIGDALEATFANVEPQPMLSGSIGNSYRRGLARRLDILRPHATRLEPAERLARDADNDVDAVGKTLATPHADTDWPATPFLAVPTVLRARQAALIEGSLLLEECFGPAVVVVECEGMAGVTAVLAALEGQLTVSIFHADADPDVSPDLVRLAQRLAGRVVWNGYPTGVALAWAMVHGGPYPASTSASTSVGVQAVHRFTRPVAFQNADRRLLPAELRDGGGHGLWRRVDGEPTLG